MKSHKKTAVPVSVEDCERAHSYVSSHWRDCEGWDSINIMLDGGDVEMLCDYIVNTGCIDPDACYPNCRELETIVLQLADNWNALTQKEQDKRHREVFTNIATFACADCNHVAFLNADDEHTYKSELKKCWSCHRPNVTRNVMYPTKGAKP